MCPLRRAWQPPHHRGKWQFVMWCMGHHEDLTPGYVVVHHIVPDNITAILLALWCFPGFCWPSGVLQGFWKPRRLQSCSLQHLALHATAVRVPVQKAVSPCRARTTSRRSFSVLPFITPGGTGEVLPPQPQPVDSVNSEPLSTLQTQACLSEL